MQLAAVKAGMDLVLVDNKDHDPKDQLSTVQELISSGVRAW
jgi:hypothetical protein